MDGKPDPVKTAIKTPAVKKRGAYPDTDERRAYMREVREMNDDAKQPGRIDSLKRWNDESVLTGILIGVVAMVLFDLIVASIRHMP